MLWRKGGVLFCMWLFSLLRLQAQGCLPTVVLGQNLTICSGTTLTLNASNPNATYLWQDGSTDAFFTVSVSGTYWVVASNACGSVSDTVQVNVLGSPAKALGPDTVLCNNGSLVLGSQIPANVGVLWSTGSSNPQITVNQAGLYWVTLSNLCGSSSDTIVVTQQFTPQLNLGPDVLLCQSNPPTLTANAGTGSEVLWSTGDTTSSIVANQSGTYWAQLSNACGTAYDTIVVLPSPLTHFFPNLMYLCGGNPLTLNPGISANSYLWSTGQNSPTITITQPGSYWMQYTNVCGTFSDTVNVLSEPAFSVDLGPQQLFACGPQTFSLQVPDGAQIIWSNGSSDTTFTALSSQTIWVEVRTNCRVLTDTLQLTLVNIPNLPNHIVLLRCPGQNLNYQLPNPLPGTTYTWSNTSLTGTSVTFTQDGNFTLYASNACGIDSTLYTISGTATAVQPNLGPNRVVCSRVWLNPRVSNYNSILWSNGSTADSIRILNGTYWVQVNTGCGVYSDTVVITSQALPAINVHDTLRLCSGQAATAAMPFRSFASYLWSNGDTNFSTSFNVQGSHWAQMQGPCDTVTVNFYVFDETLPQNPPNLGPFNICLGDTAVAQLQINWPESQISWSNGQLGRNFSTTQAGTYSYTLNGMCGNLNRTFVVNVVNPPVQVLADTVFFCPGNQATLDASSSNASTYLWNNGSTQSTLTTQSSGWHWVSMTNNCGSTIDSVFVETDVALSPIFLGNDTIVCGNPNLMLHSGLNGPFQYLWSNGATTPSIQVQQGGTYWVQASNSCETVGDTIQISFQNAPQLFLANALQFCVGSTLNVSAASPGASYLWSTGDVSPVVSLNTPGTYWVQVSNACGSLVDTFNLNFAPPVIINLGPDTAICEGDSLIINAGTGYVSRQWFNGQTGQFITVRNPGIYWVDATGFCNTRRDSIVVSHIDTPFYSLGHNQLICAQGGQTVLHGPPGMRSYLWSDGSTADSLVVSNGGTYWLTISNRCFSYTDTLEVLEEAVPIVSLGRDTTLCQGESLELGSNSHLLDWEDGSQQTLRLINQPGTYWASFANTCGLFSDTLVVDYVEPLLLNPIDTVVCLNDTVFIGLPELGDSTWWADGLTANPRRFTSPTELDFMVQNTCGIETSALTINMVDCECEVYIPNAFTPDQDGLNDHFEVKQACVLAAFHLFIYNRWGQLVFESSDPDFKWDGTFQGQLLPQGVYQTVVQVEIETGNLRRFREWQNLLNLLR